jgi:hypothetical protein
MAPTNIIIPHSIFTKMMALSETRTAVYNYLYDAIKSYFEKHLNCEGLPTNVNEIRFTLIKKNRASSEIQIHFIGRTPNHIISDEDGFLRKRMEQFYKFDSDVEFFTIVLYFFCKFYGIDYSLVSDTIYNNRIRVETSDITKKEAATEILKYIYLNLKSY